MKLFIVLSLMIAAQAWGTPANGDENLAFHVQCFEVSETCVETEAEPNSEPRTIRINKNPDMVLSKADISYARISSDEYDRPALALQLNPEATVKLAAITSANITKRLAVFAGSTFIMAPNIQSAITEGSLQVSMSQDVNLLDRVPWLKQMTTEAQVTARRQNTAASVIYVIVGLGVIGGALYFAFFRKA